MKIIDKLPNQTPTTWGQLPIGGCAWNTSLNVIWMRVRVGCKQAALNATDTVPAPAGSSVALVAIAAKDGNSAMLGEGCVCGSNSAFGGYLPNIGVTPDANKA